MPTPTEFFPRHTKVQPILSQLLANESWKNANIIPFINIFWRISGQCFHYFSLTCACALVLLILMWCDSGGEGLFLWGGGQEQHSIVATLKIFDDVNICRCTNKPTWMIVQITAIESESIRVKVAPEDWCSSSPCHAVWSTIDCARVCISQ